MNNLVNTSSFLFIPDISGFSKFVNETEINHSQHIISELLELIINSNQLGLEVVEIEGDAILFYKGEVPEIDEILSQSEKMFIDFHHHLRKYEVLRICQCGACRSATNLSLKFIAHRGTTSFIDVGGFHKPFGKEVVTVHRLLKNSIPDSEYLLLTENLLKLKSVPELKKDWVIIRDGADVYLKNKKIKYSYILLNELHGHVPPVEHFELPQKSKNPIRFNVEIQQNPYRTQDLLLNFDFKKKWYKNIRKIEYDKNKIIRVGTRHVCTIQNQDSQFQTITNDFGPGKWVYGEKLLNPPLVKEADFYFIIDNNDWENTFLSFELHYKPRKGIMKLMSIIFRFVFKRIFIRNIVRFKKICESEDHQAIVTQTPEFINRL
ncbi:MAG: DUF2652 domain-containing protein [Cyclobacteriaceae bacterium]|nr:DUF2652 domain-containing protein [Cyclobacteriaceae bacterium]